MTLLDLRSRPVLTLAALLVAACPFGCKRAAPPAEEKLPPAPVKWEGALLSALKEWTELVGTTLPLPDHVARVTAPVEGRVLSVLPGTADKPVVEGQHVDKGTVLVQLDATVIKANLAKLEAAQEVFPEEQKQAQYAVDAANLDVERLRKLKEEDDKRRAGTGGVPLVSPVDLEKAAIALKDAQAKLQASRSRQVAGAKEVEALRAQFQYYTLAAPISGRLGRILVVPGQTLSVGTQVAEVVDLDDQIDVLCFVPSSIVRKLAVGQQAFSGPIEKDPTATEPEAIGEVTYIADQAEPETGNFAVKVRFDNKEAHLRSNRVLRLHVKTHPTKPDCLSLPESAVSEDEEVPTVVIVEDVHKEKNADGKEEDVGTARRLQAVLGLRDRKLHQVEILRLEDPDKEAKKKWTGEVKDQLFIVEKGQGIQTGDKVRLEVEEE